MAPQMFLYLSRVHKSTELVLSEWDLRLPIQPFGSAHITAQTGEKQAMPKGVSSRIIKVNHQGGKPLANLHTESPALATVQQDL